MNLVTFAVFTVLVLWVAADPNGTLVAADDAGSSEPTKCGKNEEYTTCVPCPQTCKNLFPDVCAQAPCVKGCKCKTGYFRDSEGQCVSIVSCIIDNIKDRIPGIGNLN